MTKAELEKQRNTAVRLLVALCRYRDSFPVPDPDTAKFYRSARRLIKAAGVTYTKE